jgi:hypothetical protein
MVPFFFQEEATPVLQDNTFVAVCSATQQHLLLELERLHLRQALLVTSFAFNTAQSILFVLCMCAVKWHTELG